jgi:hypothetical protein
MRIWPPAALPALPSARSVASGATDRPRSAASCTVPPPAAPLASSVALSTRTLPALTVMRPPATVPVDMACSVPPTRTSLSLPAPSTISPFFMLSELARTVPPWFTTRSPAVVDWPTSTTRPPLACSVPLLATAALVAIESDRMFRLVRPSPPMSSVILRPEASATVCPSAVMVPVASLLTPAPISTTGPPLAVMSPRLRTVVVSALARSKARLVLPSRKFASLVVMASVEASSPPTLTLAPWLNSTPFGLTRNTRPLAVSCPAMVESSLPLTRFSRMLEAPSVCWMLTASFAPMEKLFQSMIARSEPCVMPSAWPPRGATVRIGLTVTMPCVANMPGW